MWLSLLAVILILAITFFQSVQGFFSAFIMAVLTVLAAAAAFGFAENLYDLFLWERMPEYGLAVSLMSIFILSLVVLRVVTDQLIRSEMLFPGWVHRVGGTAFGFVTAMTVVGMVLIGIQLLPFDRSFMGFERVNQHGVSNHVWLNPDGFVVSMIGHFSNAALSGREAFNDVHPNYLDEIGRNRIAVRRSSRHSVNKGATLSVPRAYRIQTLYHHDGQGDKTRLVPDPPPPSNREWWGVGISFDVNALDKDRHLRFTPSQVRMVGRLRKGGPTVNAYPIGIADPEAPNVADPARARHIRLSPADAVDIDPEKVNNTIYLVFEVPTTFRPEFIDFKLSGRIAFSQDRLEGEEEGGKAAAGGSPKKPRKPAGGSKTVANASSKKPQVEVRGGRTRGQRAVAEFTGYSNKLPRALDRGVLRTQRVKFRNKQIAAVDDAIVRLPEVDPTGDFAVSEFWVPRDKRLLQLGQQATHAGSTMGRALEFTNQSLRQFHITDATGRNYFPIGEWVVSDYNGEPSMEIQYHPEMAGQVGEERALKPRRGINRRNMKESDPWVFLFLVPPGTEITSFSTGGQGRGMTKISNLVAPK